MKTLKTLFFTLLFSNTLLVLAQTPELLNYQTVVRNNSGDILANQNVSFRISILKINSAGISVYAETHSATTSNTGLVNFQIGNGVVTSGVFSAIEWGEESHFLQIELDDTGGTSYQLMGTSELVSVPYALHAKTAENVSGLEAIDEGNGVGWRLVGEDPNYHNDIGLRAVDLSTNDDISISSGASGDYSYALGYKAKSEGEYSIALGKEANALGNYSAVLGYAGTATGFSSVAIGNLANASGSRSIAMGQTTANALASTTIGQFNVGGGSAISWIYDDPLFEIGNGLSINDKSNALTVTKRGRILAPSLGIMDISEPKQLTTKEYVDDKFSSISVQSGLHTIDEGNGDGLTKINSNRLNYGSIGINAVDLSNSDIASSAFGATGETSFAAGNRTTASGISSTAMGSKSLASGASSTAMGSETVASGTNSFAVGRESNASGLTSIALGNNTEASGISSAAVGENTVASGDYSLVFGKDSNVTGLHAITIGSGSLSSGSASIAIGSQTTASGRNSTAMGYQTRAESFNSNALGTNNIGGGDPINWVSTDPLFEIGNSNNPAAPSNALTILKNGTITAPSFDMNEITDDKALITKEYADINYVGTTIEAIDEGNGIGWRLTGKNSNNYDNIGEFAIDFSHSNSASSTYGASGDYSYATGSDVTASGDYSTASGNGTAAAGNYSTTMGRGTVASGNSAVSMGRITTASGNYSTAMGYDTNASGNYSTAMGFGTNTSYLSTAIGKFNVGVGSLDSWVNSDPLFEIGIGLNTGNRSNALTVLKNGDTGFRTVSPNFNIHLKQTSNLEDDPGGIGFENSNSADNWKIYHSGIHFSFSENGVRRAYVTGGTGAYTVTSDRRLKKNITEVESILSKVNSIEVYRYLYKDQDISDKETLGFMAQDIQQVFPELVETGENGFLGLNYAGFSVVAIKAIQEQQVLIENRQKMIDDLQERVAAIENNENKRQK